MKLRRDAKKKKGFSITQEELEIYKAEYKLRGGKIKKVEAPKIAAVPFDIYFPKNFVNEHGF